MQVPLCLKMRFVAFKIKILHEKLMAKNPPRPLNVMALSIIVEN